MLDQDKNTLFRGVLSSVMHGKRGTDQPLFQFQPEAQRTPSPPQLSVMYPAKRPREYLMAAVPFEQWYDVGIRCSLCEFIDKELWHDPSLRCTKAFFVERRRRQEFRSLKEAGGYLSSILTQTLHQFSRQEAFSYISYATDCVSRSCNYKFAFRVGLWMG